MNTPSNLSALPISTEQDDFLKEAKSSNPALENFLESYNTEYMREMAFIKYPDWALLERIQLNHESLFEGIKSIRVQIEESIRSEDIANAKTLLKKYQTKLNEFGAVFKAEQADLDVIKRVRDEANHFSAALKSETMQVSTDLKKASDDVDKKMQKKVLKDMKIFGHQMKLLTKELNGITATPARALIIKDEIAQIEKDRTKLANAVLTKDENYFRKAAEASKHAKSKALSQKAKDKTQNESEQVKALLVDLQSHLDLMRKGILKYERDFKAKKAGLNGMVIWHAETHHHTINPAHIVTPHDEVMSRMAISSDARNNVNEILMLKAEFDKTKMMMSCLIKKGDAKTLQLALAEINAQRTAQAKLGDTNKKVEDKDCIAAVMNDNNSLVSRITQSGVELESKALLKKLRDLISKYKKIYNHESEAVTAIRVMRKHLERRFSKVKEMDDSYRDDRAISKLLSNIDEKIKSLQSPAVSKPAAKGVVNEVESLIAELIKAKNHVKNAMSKTTKVNQSNMKYSGKSLFTSPKSQVAQVEPLTADLETKMKK